MPKRSRRRSPSRSRYHSAVLKAAGYDWKPSKGCEHRWNLEETGGPEDDFLFCLLCSRQHPGETDVPHWGWPAS